MPSGTREAQESAQGVPPIRTLVCFGRPAPKRQKGGPITSQSCPNSSIMNKEQNCNSKALDGRLESLCDCVWGLLSHSFPGSMTMITRANCLWLFYLRMGTLRNIPKHLPKFPFFFLGEIPSFLWTDMDCLILLVENKTKQTKQNNPGVCSCV